MARSGLSPLTASWLMLSLALSFIAIPVPASAQEATPPAVDSSDPEAIIESFASAEPPADLPGNLDGDIELLTWEEYYDESLNGAVGAWLLDGSLDFPLATVIVFSSNDGAQAGIEGNSDGDADFTVAGFDAWTVADRGKWICITATGPMVVLGQALPVDIDEAEEVVEERSCEVVEATLAWLSDDVIGAPLATPRASPASDPAD